MDCITDASKFHEWMDEYAKYRRGEKGDAKADMFLGYVSAVFDVVAWEDLICTPPSMTREDVAVVVLRRFDDFMKAVSLLPSETCASNVVAPILIERFPCPSKPDAKPPAK